jgi:hypothetical protein
LFGAQLIGAFLFIACLLLKAWAGPFSLVGYPWTVIQTNKKRSHTLRVEEDIHLPRSERTCKCCNIFIDGERAVEDEMHFMLECPLFSQERKTLFEKLRIEYDPNEKASCMRNIMNPESSKGWNYLLKYINKCDEKRKVELSVIRQM